MAPCLCLSIFALASVELALAAEATWSSHEDGLALAWGVCGADGCSADAGESDLDHLVDDSALLQIRSVARMVPLDFSGPEVAVFENVSDPNITALLQEEAEKLRFAHPSPVEIKHFRLVRALRRRGFKCPGGTYFKPHFGEFRWDCRLWRAARLWSTRMAQENFVAHRHGGSTSCKRTDAQGFPHNRGCGENIAAGGSTPQEALKQLKESDHYCLNMMEPAFNKLGVGYAENSRSMYHHYWTDDFGDWHAGPDRSCIGGSPAPTPAPGCADIDTFNCQFYKEKGYCETSPNVIAQCKETCGIGHCGSGGHPIQGRPADDCRDTDPNCRLYANKGFCSTANIQAVCKRACGTCDGGL